MQHTTGQAFVMAFQAGGPHAQDRALEAIAYAYDEMSRVPARVLWEKPAKPEPLRIEKTYAVVPRGIALTIGCSTFPTWNAYPGLFASLVTGNPVIVKPHPQAVLPLAITVEILRDVLREARLRPQRRHAGGRHARGRRWPSCSRSARRSRWSTTPARPPSAPGSSTTPPAWSTPRKRASTAS